MKVEIIKYNRNYNVIIIYKNNLLEYYLEKKGYGDLFYMFGAYDNFEIIPEIVEDHILVAKKRNFWY